MQEHSIFYYPYASFTEEQAPLLKAVALYFDKLYILDPRKASWGTVGPGPADRDVTLLEQAGLLVRVSPEEVLRDYEDALSAAIRTDVNDEAFIRRCEKHAQGSSWTLALAKVPKEIRDDPRYKPLDESMERAMGVLPKELGPGPASAYSESFVGFYDEYRESQDGVMEYRYADFPLPVGEAIMVNHALFGGFLHAGATPLTDDAFHHDILALKLARTRQTPEIAAVLQSRAAQRKLKHGHLAMKALTDLDLAVVSPELDMEDILEFRKDNQDALGKLRERLDRISRRIRETPWSEEFADNLEHDVLPDLHDDIEEAGKARDAWLGTTRGKNALKVVGISAGAASVALGLAITATPLAPVGLVIAGLSLLTGVAVPGAELALDWKEGKKKVVENGMHYLAALKSK